MIETRLLGPKDDQYAVLAIGSQWLATTKEPYAEAVKAAIAAAIANGNDQRASAVEGSADTTPTGQIPVPPLTQSEAHQNSRD